MRIRTQDKKMIGEFTKVFTTKNFGTKTYAVMGDIKPDTLSSVTLGIYKNEDLAIMEIDRMMEFFSQSPKGIYQMS